MKPLRAVFDKMGRSRRKSPIYASAPQGYQPPHIQTPASPSYAPASAASAYRSDSVRASELTVGDYANGIPNIKIGEVLRSFFRQLVWVLPLMLVGAIAAWHFTSDFKRTYKGEGSLLVQLGDEYVYQPIAGTGNGSGLMQTPDTIALNEIALIKNPEVMDRVIGEIAATSGGLSAFAPEIAAKMASHREGSTGYQLAYMELRKMVGDSFYVGHRPKSSVIDLGFQHENPQMSVSTLNRLMDAYLSYRRTVFVEGAGDVILQRRQDTEEQLASNEQKISTFLSKNDISDFESEQKGAQKRTEDLKAALNTLRGDIAQAERSLATVEDQLRATPETVALYTDDRLSNRLAQAQLEKQQLLAKYLPNSNPVRDKEREIEQMVALQRANQGQAAGGRRVGINTVYQSLETQRNNLQATANSLREKEFTLQQQLNSVDGKLRRMTALMPEYRDLLRGRETLNDRLKNYLVKEQEALINQQQAESSSENVRVLSRATYPIKGRNMRMLAFIGAVLAWGFTLFMLALFRVFSDPRLYAVPDAARNSIIQPQPVMAQPAFAEPAFAEPSPYYDNQPIPEPVPYSHADAYAPGPEVYQPAATYVQAGYHDGQYAQPYDDGSQQYGQAYADGSSPAQWAAPADPAYGQVQQEGFAEEEDYNPYLAGSRASAF